MLIFALIFINIFVCVHSFLFIKVMNEHEHKIPSHPFCIIQAKLMNTSKVLFSFVRSVYNIGKVNRYMVSGGCVGYHLISYL